MRILVTNDDAIGASQLLPLIRWCQKHGDVTAVVPKYEQSGKSHGIELHKAFEAKQVELAPGVTVWSVDSTPADCVRFAVLGLGMEFDLVISGINRGLNIGADMMYSGTVSAICEAVNLGIPAVAFSTAPEYYDQAVGQLDRVWDYFQQHDLLSLHNLYNVNIPCDPKQIRITHQGGPYYSDNFLLSENDLYRPCGHSIWVDSHDDTLDTDATLHGNLTITPLTIDRTEKTIYAKLSALNP